MKTSRRSAWAISLALSFVGCTKVASPEPTVAEAPVPAAAPIISEFGHDAPSASPETPPPPEADPALTDADKYHVVLENSEVRVLRYSDTPGGKTNQHHHPEFVLYALSPFRRKLTFPDGTSKERQFAAGDVIWMPEQTHIGENTGNTNTEVVIVEIKRH